MSPRPDDESYSTLPPGERRPAIVDLLSNGSEPLLAWRNVLGGQTWRIGDRYLKWSSDASGVDLGREVVRLRRLAGLHPVPTVLDEGHDGGGRWFITAAMPGRSAIDPRWLGDAATAVRAIADGLRRIHAIPLDAIPADWTSWVTRAPGALGPRPPMADPVVVHGDACAPNTLLGADGEFLATVDLGDVAVGDRWADLAVASMSLGWNYGPGWDSAFYDAYGVRPDPARIAYYRALWRLES